MLLVRDSDLGNASPRQCRTLCRICCAATRRVSLNPNRGPSLFLLCFGPAQATPWQLVGTISAFPRGVQPTDHLFVFAGHAATFGQIVTSVDKCSAQEDAGQYARPGNLEFGIRILCQHRLKKLPMPIVLSITRSLGSHSRMPVENVKLRVDGGASRGGSGFLQEARQDQREKDAVEERRETSLIAR